MRDDLISREALLCKLKYGENDSDEEKELICAIRRIIKEMTIAFDKGKVIEELQHAVTVSRMYWKKYDDAGAFHEMRGFESAIEILEKGGIE